MKVNQLKAGVILTYLSTGLSALISLVYTPIMLGILGQSEYGVYTLVNSVVANFGILGFGFSQAYVRFYSRYKVKNDHIGIARLNGMFMTVFTVIAGIALLAGFGLVQNIEAIFKNGLSTSEIATAKILMCISVINIAFSFPASVLTSFITANEKYIFLKAVNTIKIVFSPLLNLPILLLGYGSIGMVLTTLVLNVFADVLNFIFSVNKLNMRFDFKKFDVSLLKEIWVFSFYIFLVIVTNQINWNVDKFLLGIFQGSVVVAIYGVAAQINSLYINMSVSVSNVFIPRINALVCSEKNNWKLSTLFTKIGRIQFFIQVLLLELYVFFGKYFISIWAGTEYHQAYAVGLVLLFSVTIECIQNAGNEMQRAKNLHKFRAIAYFLIAIGNILLSIPLCRKYGALGAAVGTAVSLIIGNGLIMNIYYHKKVGIDIISFWKSILSIFPALILPTAYGIIANQFFPLSSIYMFVLQAGLMAVIYCGSMWFFGMNKTEKQLITGPLSRIICRGNNNTIKR